MISYLLNYFYLAPLKIMDLYLFCRLCDGTRCWLYIR